MTDCCATDHAAAAEEPPARLWQAGEIRAALLSGVLLIAAFALRGLLPAGWQPLAFAPALAVGGATFVPEALRGLVRGRLGVGTLMTIAAAGAVVLGEWAEAAMLAFLFSIAEGLEAYALARTRQGLRGLLDLVPATATVRRGGVETVVDPGDLAIGDTLVVRPGERVATDGIVRRGRSSLDLSAITGESVPVEHDPGDAVHAGAVNGAGVLGVEVTARAEDNSLARIVRIVEEAQDRKGASQRLAERVAAPLVPGVLVVAALVAVVGSVLGDPAVWTHRALVVLVAAAPCAFALSVPVGVVAAVGAATRSGVLIKGGAALEALDRVRTVAFDKTGTLTRNTPSVVAVTAGPGHTDEQVLAVAAALERHSEHPLAAAVLAAHGPGRAADAVHAVAGRGLAGELDGAPARLGKPGWIAPGPLADDVARWEDDGATVVLVERDGAVVGLIAVRDELRGEAADVVARLRGLAITRVAMLTGDNRRTALALAESAGIDEVAADLLPEDKADAVAAMAAEAPTAMVGDGINDAPALAVADVGVAMGAMGTDVAIETADVALMGDDLRQLSATLAHARRAMRIVRQNLAVSGGILVVLVPLAATGTLGLAAVVALHELAEVLVIANGVRAGRRSAFSLPTGPPAPERGDGDRPGPRRAAVAPR